MPSHVVLSDPPVMTPCATRSMRYLDHAHCTGGAEFPTDGNRRGLACGTQPAIRPWRTGTLSRPRQALTSVDGAWRHDRARIATAGLLCMYVCTYTSTGGLSWRSAGPA